MKYPSVKTLREVFGDNAALARRMLQANRATLADHPAGAARIAECFHPPTTGDVRMHVLNALAQAHGVEAFQLRSGEWCDYLNTGDTYNVTLLHCDAWRMRYRVATWGDVIERDERRNGRRGEA